MQEIITLKQNYPHLKVGEYWNDFIVYFDLFITLYSHLGFEERTYFGLTY